MKSSDLDLDKKEAGWETESEPLKASLRIPTADPYAFLEVEVYGSPEAIWQAYGQFTALVKGEVINKGLPRVEWNRMLEDYARGLGMTVDQNERMDEYQKKWIRDYDLLQARLEKYDRE